MTNFEKELEALGFKVWNTGGNCLAYGLLIPSGSDLNSGDINVEILVTDGDCSIDFEGEVAVGIDEDVEMFSSYATALRHIKINIEHYS